MNLNRLETVTDFMKVRDMSQLLISDPASIFYLTGKWIDPGERMLVLYLNLKGAKKLFLNVLFPVQEDLGLDLVYFTDTDDSVALLAGHLSDEGEIGIDKIWPARFLLRLMAELNHAHFILGSDALDQARMIKDLQEQQLMRDASKLNDQGMQRLVETFDPGETELNISRKLKDFFPALGADGSSFSPIIAFGPNAALPHHNTGKSRVQPGDSIIMDIGCVREGYCSDMTRTFFYKTVSEKARQVYELVRSANQAAIDKVRPGVRFCDIDDAARNVIEAGGYGAYFTHRTGHAIGIEVHEPGDVSSANTDLLKPGMIFSLEPGIYLDGEFGVRIEDLVLVTDTGCEVLNYYPKDLQVLE